MNRRKQIIQKLSKRYKQAQAKKQPKNKPPYIAKADREEAEVTASETQTEQPKDADA
jgi:hypothetical protein